jgi:hypothetical protein
LHQPDSAKKIRVITEVITPLLSQFGDVAVGELNRMIPTIGLMIGMYIITRMIELLMAQKKDQYIPLVLRIFAGLTIGICILGVLILLSTPSPT